MVRQQQRARAVGVALLLLGLGWYAGSRWHNVRPTPLTSAVNTMSLPVGLVRIDDEVPPNQSDDHESIETARLQARVQQLEAQLLQLRTSTARAQLPQTSAA
eukprot:COSAG02_NODE_29997_length_559_cov_0.730435_1_plen_101_part_01